MERSGSAATPASPTATTTATAFLPMQPRREGTERRRAHADVRFWCNPLSTQWHMRMPGTVRSAGNGPARQLRACAAQRRPAITCARAHAHAHHEQRGGNPCATTAGDPPHGIAARGDPVSTSGSPTCSSTHVCVTSTPRFNYGERTPNGRAFARYARRNALASHAAPRQRVLQLAGDGVACARQLGHVDAAGLGSGHWSSTS